MISITSLFNDSNSNANFRTWGSAFQAMLELGGFWQRKTSETGQIDWTTVAAPAAGVLAGFEMYQVNDSLASSFKLYMKVEFGSSGFATRGARLQITIGTSTNGSGTLFGLVSSAFNFDPGNTAANAGTTTLMPCYCSGGEG